MAEVPIMPPAPGRFRMTNGCLRMPLVMSASCRITVSVLPPGAVGTMTVMARAGYLSCAWTGSAEPAASSAETTASHRGLECGPAENLDQPFLHRRGLFRLVVTSVGQAVSFRALDWTRRLTCGWAGS